MRPGRRTRLRPGSARPDPRERRAPRSSPRRYHPRGRPVRRGTSETRNYPAVPGEGRVGKGARGGVKRFSGTVVAGASLATMLDARQAPAQIRGTTLRMLKWSHFVPAYDQWFDKFA